MLPVPDPKTEDGATLPVPVPKTEDGARVPLPEAKTDDGATLPVTAEGNAELPTVTVIGVPLAVWVAVRADDTP